MKSISGATIVAFFNEQLRHSKNIAELAPCPCTCWLCPRRMEFGGNLDGAAKLSFSCRLTRLVKPLPAPFLMTMRCRRKPPTPVGKGCAKATSPPRAFLSWCRRPQGLRFKSASSPLGQLHLPSLDVSPVYSTRRGFTPSAAPVMASAFRRSALERPASTPTAMRWCNSSSP